MKLEWFRFSDSHSGGGQKTEYDAYHIQAPDQDTAVQLFEAYTRCDAHHTTCPCCGPDWDIYPIEDGYDPFYRDVLVLDWATITGAIDAEGITWSL